MNDPALEFQVRPGRIRRLLLAGVFLLALMAIFFSGLGLAAVLGLAFLTAGAAWLSGRCQARRVRLGPGPGILLELSGGKTVAGRLAGTPFVSPWFVGLGIQPFAGRRCHVGLFRDQLEPDAFRRLAARLRTGS